MHSQRNGFTEHGIRDRVELAKAKRLVLADPTTWWRPPADIRQVRLTRTRQARHAIMGHPSDVTVGSYPVELLDGSTRHVEVVEVSPSWVQAGAVWRYGYLAG